VKCKISHGKSEEKSEFKSPWSESLRIKYGTLIMLGPFYINIFLLHVDLFIKDQKVQRV
jgi:hypothetical protein